MLKPAKHWKHFVAMALIGDGMMAVVRPGRDAAMWEIGPEWWQDLMQQFRKHPALTRAVGAAQVAGGIWWALCQERDPGARS